MEWSTSALSLHNSGVLARFGFVCVCSVVLKQACARVFASVFACVSICVCVCARTRTRLCVHLPNPGALGLGRLLASCGVVPVPSKHNWCRGRPWPSCGRCCCGPGDRRVIAVRRSPSAAVVSVLDHLQFDKADGDLARDDTFDAVASRAQGFPGRIPAISHSLCDAAQPVHEPCGHGYPRYKVLMLVQGFVK